jgi:hypothetical protein
MSTAQAQKEQQIKNAHDPVGDQSSVKMSFPVDLNQLFTLSYSFDALKSALEFLTGQLQTHRDTFDQVNKYLPINLLTLNRKIMQVEKLASDGLERASKLNFVTNDLTDQLKVIP